jgi:hypothetical protein
VHGILVNDEVLMFIYEVKLNLFYLIVEKLCQIVRYKNRVSVFFKTNLNYTEKNKTIPKNRAQIQNGLSCLFVSAWFVIGIGMVLVLVGRFWYLLVWV